ncbi:MAG: hypothetical protein ACQET5_13925 [Halobacteriota archaeon]
MAYAVGLASMMSERPVIGDRSISIDTSKATSLSPERTNAVGNEWTKTMVTPDYSWIRRALPCRR